jgi:hypothetical protein
MITTIVVAPGHGSVSFERRAVIVCRVLGRRWRSLNVFHGGRDAAFYRDGKPNKDG